MRGSGGGIRRDEDPTIYEKEPIMATKKDWRSKPRPVADPRQPGVSVRLTASEREKLRRMAERAGVSLSDFIRQRIGFAGGE